MCMSILGFAISVLCNYFSVVVIAQLVTLEMVKLALMLMSVQEMSVIISVSTLQDHMFVYVVMVIT